MKKDIFKALENADKAAIEKMSEKYSAASDKEKERLYRQIAEKSGNSGFDAAETQVYNVETYRKPAWYKHFAAVSAFVLVIGGIAGGLKIVENANRPHIEAEEIQEESAVSEYIPETVEIEEITEATTEVSEDTYMELQLHETSPYTETLEEAHKLQSEHQILMPWNERYGVDTEHYTDLLCSGDHDINSLEAKSYIYHIMLNTPLYFSTANGHYQSLDDDGTITNEVDFQVDIEAQEGYSSSCNSYGQKTEHFNYDDMAIEVNYDGETRKFYNVKETTYMFTEDNYRHIDIAPPDIGVSICTQHSMLVYASNVLSADGLAMSRLGDFDRWNVTEITNFIGRDAALIEGTSENGYPFKITVDIKTGFLLEYIENNIIETRMTELEVDTPIERIEYPDADKIDFWTLEHNN
ncbi:MAG: hypothetical protein K5979_15045 [Ruminococcus sp.]|nr:hypothetical protein [Ruminococcus sp.]